jgi:hypothetical protein
MTRERHTAAARQNIEVLFETRGNLFCGKHIDMRCG